MTISPQTVRINGAACEAQYAALDGSTPPGTVVCFDTGFGYSTTMTITSWSTTQQLYICTWPGSDINGSAFASYELKLGAC